MQKHTHHASRTFFVSGHAQQALHFGFSAGVAVVDAIGADAGTVGAVGLLS